MLEVLIGEGGIIDEPWEVGGWPSLDAGVPCEDWDGDGMPDSFEDRFGFNPADPADGVADADGDGYTNVEEFLNFSAPFVAN
jgi:hypothetical protein